MIRDDGGPAFPVPNLQMDEDFNGMSLRDYFAAHCSELDMQAAHAELAGKGDLEKSMSPMERRAVARLHFANAMLKARQS